MSVAAASAETRPIWLCADDYGISPAVSKAIRSLVVQGRLNATSVMVAARPVNRGRNMKLVAAYETISETHWNAPHIEPGFVPNFCIDITNQIDAKLEAMRCFQSQLHEFPGARSIESLSALALFRGSQAGYGYAEAFHVIRMGAELFL